jgi:hypothetical protein
MMIRGRIAAMSARRRLACAERRSSIHHNEGGHTTTFARRCVWIEMAGADNLYSMQNISIKDK